jgi:uncharacterized membrane protein YdjX (TVP38/TMEM64 family)
MSLRTLLLLGVLLALIAFYASGSLERLDPQALRDTIREARFFGPLLYLLLFAGLHPLGMPGLVFMLTAIAVWPPWQAFLLLWAGAVGAGCVAYLLARTIGREWVSKRLPARFRRLDDWVAVNALRTVIVVRMVVFLSPPMHWALGLSSISFRTLLVGSVIGFLPTAAFVAFVGASAFAWLRTQPRELYALALVGVLVVALVVQRLRARRARIDATS